MLAAEVPEHTGHGRATVAASLRVHEQRAVGVRRVLRGCINALIQHVAMSQVDCHRLNQLLHNHHPIDGGSLGGLEEVADHDAPRVQVCVPLHVMYIQRDVHLPP